MSDDKKGDQLSVAGVDKADKVSVYVNIFRII